MPNHCDATTSGLPIEPQRAADPAFQNEDRTIAVVVMNPTATGGEYYRTVGTNAITVSARPHSIQTVVF